MERRSSLAWCSAVAGALLLILCLMTALSGVSQQSFEWVAPAEEYGRRLVHDGPWLRWIIAVDDLFVAAYVLATVLLAERLHRERGRLLPTAIAVAGVTAGVLDVIENHDLLTMLRWVETGGTLDDASIVARSVLSQTKWLLGHLAFVAVGVLWRGRTPADRVLIASLIGFQLPVGALCWTLEDPSSLAALIWIRYGAFLAGFGTLAWLTRVSDGSGGAVTGAPG